MDNLIFKSDCKDGDLNKKSHPNRLEASELDILRKAYELILENSEMFYNELGRAFIIESERRESSLI